ncbi:MAG: DMT family transporter, partial [Anaerolineales bacterium]|nr:DMT family transporter [Anaerolineales bacterium]
PVTQSLLVQGQLEMTSPGTVKTDTNVFANHQRIRADLTLLLVAVIWGSAFTFQRIAAAVIGPFLFNGARFFLGMLAMTPFIIRTKRMPSRTEWIGGTVAGILLFCGSNLQQAGLKYTTAGKAGFITGLYVVLVPLFLAIIWKKRSHWTAWLASILAAMGLYLLSTIGRFSLAPGDGVVLVGAFVWALHVILIGNYVSKVDPFYLAAIQYLVCSTISLTAGLFFESNTLAGLSSVWWSVAFAGIISVGVGYTLQIVAQRQAPPTDAAVILSGEAVFAAIVGWLFLNEGLTGRQLAGCVLMLAGMCLAQISHVRMSKNSTDS